MHEKLFPHSLIENWFKDHGRQLPWRINRDPYFVWLSEIMLQQTQVVTVIDYFNRFAKAFPTVLALKNATLDEIMPYWSGLGYYSRCRNLHRTAQLIVEKYDGIFPNTLEELISLPGIGSYTAGAILTFAFEKPASLVDGNIARVLARIFNDEKTINSSAGKKHFESLSLKLVQQTSHILLWQEGLMELGALICKPKDPQCFKCPAKSKCQAYQLNTISKIPKKIKKQSRQLLKVAYAIIYDENHVWLEKNSNSNLFKGLFSPPNLSFIDDDDINKVIFKLVKERNLEMSLPLFPPVLIKRTLTHRDLQLYGFLIPTSSIANPSQYWVKKDQLNQIGISTTIRSLFDKTILESNPKFF